jgi:hypothetical protein
MPASGIPQEADLVPHAAIITTESAYDYFLCDYVGSDTLAGNPHSKIAKSAISEWGTSVRYTLRVLEFKLSLDPSA